MPLTSNIKIGFAGALLALMIVGLPGTAHAVGTFSNRCSFCHFNDSVDALPNSTNRSGAIRAANNRAYLDAMIAGGMTTEASVSAADRDAIVAEIAASLSTVGAAITSAAPPGGKVGTAYSFTVTATGAPQLALGATSLGGDPLPGAFTKSAGTWPPGLSIDGSSGVISGTPTTAGTFTGTIQADNLVGAVTQNFSIHIVAAPSNDNFANAADISGGSFVSVVSSLNATKEPGEPNHAGNAGGHSIWWDWIAPSTNPVFISTCYPQFIGQFQIPVNGTFDTLLGVYTGNAVNALTTVASSNNALGRGGCAYSTSAELSFNAVHNTTYHIAVDGTNGAAGNVRLSLTQNQTLTIINSGTGNGVVTSSPAGIACPPTCTASFPPNTAMTLTSTPNPGSVFVGIGGQSTNPYSFSLTGGFTDFVNFYALTNDNFATRKVINPLFPGASGYNIGATKEAGEPNHAFNAGGKSVWWSWTAPKTGAVNIVTNGSYGSFSSNFDTTLAVYTGSAVNALTLVASNDDFLSPQSSVTFQAIAGTEYQIAVDGYNGASGFISLNIHQPGNNNFATRLLDRQAADWR